ncbi:MAG: guanylate kinase [Lachnospiraceae bacterium]|nr:guanylate kinase [Lachnospiraceae bacterium]MBQ7781689.1 guanylate kinase [Lachnospiraceae bacterium]
MGKIVYLMGKSSTGKDTIYRNLLAENRFDLQKIIPYTTRPIRIKESNGVQYFFTDEAGYKELLDSGRVIEHRTYNTYHGLWRYFTVDDGQIDLDAKNYICIGTLESYESTKAYFGAENMVPVLIELDDGARLQRALDRERKQSEPKYEEMCRRFLADSEDFAEEKIVQAGITRRFYNENLEQCLKEIDTYIAKELGVADT